MECPSNELLAEFIGDPDAAMLEFPGFAEHLEECPQCRLRIDHMSRDQSDPTLWMHVLGDSGSDARVLPQIVGYEIQEQVGEGGYGTVYRGVQVSTGRQVAIKFISRTAPAQAERFTAEQAALLRSDHPHIVALIDAGTTTSGLFIVYPWMKTNLSSHMKAIELAELNDVLNLLIPICEAVCHLHRLEIIHRDIKPSNILLNTQDQPKLADFGLAKDLSSNSPSSTLTEPVGTPSYMAPEQTGLVDVQVGYETDVYGLGALMYALTVGRPPFQAANSLHVIHQVIHDMPVPLRRLRPDVPLDYETVCLKCLSKPKTERYQTAADLLSDLKHLQRGQRVQARPISLLRKAKHWLARHPAVRSVLLATGVILVACLVAVAYIQRAFEFRARRDLLRYAVEGLLRADAPELPAIYAVLDNQPSEDLAFWLQEAENESDVHKLRKALVQPSVRLTWNVLLRGVEQCEAADLLPIRTQLLSHYAVTDGFKRQLNNYLRKEAKAESVLRLVAACPPESLDLDEQLCDEILTALAQCKESELAVWQNCLDAYASLLTKQLVRMLDTHTVGPLQSLQTPVNLCLLWNVDQPERMIELLERSSADSISLLLRHKYLLTPELKDVALRRWKELFQFEERGWQENRRETLMDDLAKSYCGAASSRGGFLVAVPVENLQSVFETLTKNGYSAVSLYPWLDQEFEAYAVCFQKSSAQNQFGRFHTPEEVASSIKNRRSDHWYPASIWVPKYSNDFVVLWSSDEQNGGALVEYDPRSQDLDSESFASATEAGQSRLTFTWKNRIFGFQRRLGMPVESACAEIIRSLPTRLGHQGVHSEKPNYARIYLDREPLERFICSGQFQQFNVVAPDFVEFQRKLAELLPVGFLPRDIFVDQDYCVRAFCDLDGQTMEKVQACRAVNALVCWACGDREPLLADLKCRPCAHARGTLIGELSRVCSLEKLFETLEQVSDADQLNALLVASAAMDWKKTSLPLEEMAKRLRKFVFHDDSGVHFAAKWLVTTKLQATIDTALLATHPPTSRHRGWFYSPSGIPFVVINPREVQLITDDIRTPWSQMVVSNAVNCERPFAISAVEISRQEAGRFLETFNLPAAPGFESQGGQEPMALINYKDMLRFCRELSRVDGLRAWWNHESTPDDKSLEVVWDKALLKQECYRLPTGIEWEMACRCGSSSSTFFGDNQDFLSTYAWNSDNTRLTTMPSGLLAPNPWGLYDVLGNVYEATLGSSQDHLNSLWLMSEIEYGFANEMGLNVRGGSFLSNRVYCASGTRHGIPQFSKDRNSGFRIVRVLSGR